MNFPLSGYEFLFPEGSGKAPLQGLRTVLHIPNSTSQPIQDAPASVPLNFVCSLVGSAHSRAVRAESVREPEWQSGQDIGGQDLPHRSVSQDFVWSFHPKVAHGEC